MRLFVPMLCGVALVAGSVQATAQEHKRHSGMHMHAGSGEHHRGHRASARHSDRGYRSSHMGAHYGYGSLYAGYAPSYGYTSYGSEYRYGLAYGYRANSDRLRDSDDDDCD